MSLPSAVHVSSTFESGAPRMSLPCAVRQFSILHFFRSPMNLLPSAVHVSSTFEFVAMYPDSLSADPQVNPPFSAFFGVL